MKAGTSRHDARRADVVSVGTAFGGAVTVRVAPLDVPPPGVGEKTVIVCVPVLDTSLAGMAAVSWVVEPNVVVRLLPSTFTTEPVTNPVPATVSVKAPLPATTFVGLTLVRVGAGFGVVTVRVAPVDVPPPVPGRTRDRVRAGSHHVTRRDRGGQLQC